MTTTKRALVLFVVLAACWVPVLVAPGTVQFTAALVELANTVHPYFVPERAALIYFWTPLVVVSACVLLLSPGLLLAPVLQAATTIERWLLSAMALSLVIVSTATAVVQSLSGKSLQGGSFAALVVTCSLLSATLLMWQSWRGRVRVWSLDQRAAVATLLSYIAAPVLVLVTLAPKFYWENFNGDGAHAFEASRLLLRHALPFFDPSAGPIAGFPGLTSMLFTYPNSWFIRLFGELEVSARLPLLLYLVALHAAVVALAEEGQSVALGIVEQWLLWVQIGVYAIVMAFSATYNPYHADLALPATQDTLTLVCFLGFVLGFVRRETLWTMLFLVLTYLSLPNGALLAVMWMLAVWLVWRPRPWPELRRAAAVLLGCVALGIATPRVLSALQMPPPGIEYGAAELLGRFAVLQFLDWRRLAFLAVPGGILPALALLGWPWQDRVARALTLVTLGYFGFFYVQTFVALHHFAPAMLLPLVVFWRSEVLTRPQIRSAVLGLAAAGGVVAVWLSLPTHAHPDTTARRVGGALEDRIGGYERSDPLVFRRTLLLQHLFPPDWDPRVPRESYGGSELVWNFYAHHSQTGDTERTYVVQSASDPEPPGAQRLVVRDGVALLVRSEAVWAAHRALRPPSPAGSPMFSIPPEILFHAGIPANGPPVLDLRQVARRLGIDVEAVRDMLSGTEKNE